MQYFESKRFDQDWKKQETSVSIGFLRILKTDETKEKISRLARMMLFYQG